MEIRAIIAKRRDGGTHSRKELDWLCRAAGSGDIPDYQIAAWLMAAYLKPLSPQETCDLTLAMAESGTRLNLAGIPKPWVDKHSTGGVGDKTSIVLAPVMAACGITVVKMSGRGLGITGGTLDKLASIPGFNTDLLPDELLKIAAKTGVAIGGQNKDLAPADKVFYAMRDVTETVSSLPLITSSILSKKVASGAETILLDIKCGSGSFNPDLATAEKLAGSLVETGKRAGIDVRATITDMDQPLGSAVGNALEVKEALEVLGRPAAELSDNVKRFRELCVYFVAQALRTTGLAGSVTEALERVESVLNSGRAMEKCKVWFNAQGATVDPATTSWLPVAPQKAELRSERSGFVLRVDARIVGEVALDLGAGRKEKADEIFPAVGIEVMIKVGQKIAENDVLFVIHGNSDSDVSAAIKNLRTAVSFSDSPVPPRRLILKVL